MGFESEFFGFSLRRSYDGGLVIRGMIYGAEVVFGGQPSNRGRRPIWSGGSAGLGLGKLG